MTQFVRRRTIGFSVIIIATAVMLVSASAMKTALRRPEAWLGWILLGLIISLAAYRLRKQVSVLPLGSSATWLQLHIYTGILTLPVFLMHTGFRMPVGIIEVPLGLIFLTVFVSGVVGLILTRHIPRRLTSRNEEVIFERIPAYIRRLRLDAESCVLGNEETPPSEVVGRLYSDYLQSFFKRPCNFLRHVLHSGGPLASLIRRLEDTRRFLPVEEQSAIDRLIELVTRKDELDYQFTMQTLLKYWLFIHVPLTWALLVFAAFHIIIARAFT